MSLQVLFGVLNLTLNVANPCAESLTRVNGIHAPNVYCSGDLIFEDNFDDFDMSKWKLENTMSGGGNNEFQWYVPDGENSYTQDGNLHFKTSYTSDIFGEDFLSNGHALIPPDECTDLDSDGCEKYANPDQIINPIRSAKVTTVDSFAFTFGTLEIRAKMPAGDWLWPALWMLPKYSTYGYFPASGEIDLMEMRGNRNLFDGDTNVGVEQGGSTLHFGPREDVMASVENVKNREDPFSDDFHIYKFVWSPDGIQFFYDDDNIGNVDVSDGFWARGGFDGSGMPNPWVDGSPMAPFDQDFFIILNLAVGGTGYFGDSYDNRDYPKPWENSSPRAAADFWNGRSLWEPTWNLDSEDSHMQVDYVRVYAL